MTKDVRIQLVYFLLKITWL